MVLGALAASMLLTFDLSQQKLTEDVLHHVCNPKLFIKILISSLLISHLTLLTMHQIQPFLLVGPSKKEWQAPSHTWHLTKCKGQQEYCCISTVALSPYHQSSAQLHSFTSHLCHAEANGAQSEHECVIARWANSTTRGENIIPYCVAVDLSLLPSFGNRVGVAGGQRG